MPGWFFAELVTSKPQGAAGNTRVFASGTIPSMWKFKQLLKLAGVRYKGDQGRQADFSALRRSLNCKSEQDGQANAPAGMNGKHPNMVPAVEFGGVFHLFRTI
jgi:hypothetical protein